MNTPMNRSAAKLKWFLCLAVPAAVFIVSSMIVGLRPAKKGVIRTFFPPYIEIEGGQVKNLGVLEAGSQQSASFTITNTGTQRVTFRDHIATSCGCTSAKLSKNSLDPNESCEIELSLHVANRYSEKDQVTATIDIAEPKPDAFSVALVFSSYRRWSLSRGHIRISRPEGFRSVEEVSLFRHGDTELAIEDVRKSSENIDVEITPFDEKNRAVIRISHTMPKAPSKENESLLIKVSGAEMSEVPIEMTYTSLPSLFFTPKTLLINLDRETALERDLVLESLSDTEIVEITSEHRAVSLGYDREFGTRHPVKLRVDPELLAGNIDRITVKAAVKNGEGETAECELPVIPVRMKADEEEPGNE